MRAAAEDLDLGQRQRHGVVAGQVSPQRHAVRGRRGLRDRQRNRDGGVAAQPGLVGRAVEMDERGVDGELVAGIEAGERARDRAVHVGDRPIHAEAAEARAAVAQVDGLARAARRAGRRDGASRRAAGKRHLRLDGRPAARIPDAAGVHAGNDGALLMPPTRAPAPSGSPPAAADGRARTCVWRFGRASPVTYSTGRLAVDARQQQARAAAPRCALPARPTAPTSRACDRPRTARRTSPGSRCAGPAATRPSAAGGSARTPDRTPDRRTTRIRRRG